MERNVVAYSEEEFKIHFEIKETGLRTIAHWHNISS
jgi:hypothetical protein